MFEQLSKYLTITVIAMLISGCGAKSVEIAASGAKTAHPEQENRHSAAMEQLSGRYYLRGVMETASGLELSKDGKFRWYLIVGALDVIGNGTWEMMDDKVRLTYEDVKTNAEIPELTETILEISGENLKPVDGSSGVYVRTRPAPPQDKADMLNNPD